MQPGRRFLLDGTMARGGGGFTYLTNVVPALARLAPRDRFLLLARSPQLAESLPALPNLEVELLPEVGLPGRFRFSYLEAPRKAAAWEADLYYSAGETVPLKTHCPAIASFQNPNIFTGISDWNRRQQVRLRILQAISRLSAKCADRVLFVSQDSAQWIGDSIGLPKEKRAWLHHGIDAAAWRPDRASHSSDPFILSVSSIYRYKNYVRLIQAYAELAKRRPEVPKLVIIGDNADPPYAKEMEAARELAGDVAHRIQILGEVPYADVRSYYQAASIFVFPSYRETFGIPMIEAMAAETPLVASDIPIFHEVGGNAAFYVDPFNPSSIARGMEEALFTDGARELLLKRGRERVRRFTWERTAVQLMSVFKEVLA